jgi:hypothetical protein
MITGQYVEDGCNKPMSFVPSDPYRHTRSVDPLTSPAVPTNELTITCSYFHLMFEGGYPDDWDSRRRRVYDRDGYECQNCGRNGGPIGNAELHAHHIVPISKGGTHKQSNLITLCSGCHWAIHRNRMAPSHHSTELLQDVQRILLTSEIPTEKVLEINEAVMTEPHLLNNHKEMQRLLLQKGIPTIEVQLISRIIEIQS